MAEWTITPSSATIDENGFAVFPPNETSGNVEYSVVYTDDNGCSVSTTFVVRGSGGDPPTPPGPPIPPVVYFAFSINGEDSITVDITEDLSDRHYEVLSIVSGERKEAEIPLGFDNCVMIESEDTEYGYRLRFVVLEHEPY